MAVSQDSVVRVLDMTYSVEQARRDYACPNEIVTFSCTIIGTTLKWEYSQGNSPIAAFIAGRPDTVEGKGYVKNDVRDFEANFSTILDYVFSQDNGHVECKSTLILMPTSPTPKTTEITCVAERISNETVAHMHVATNKSKIFQVSNDKCTCSAGKVLL